MPVNEVIYLMNKRYSIWQILAGSSHRSYADQFIDYGVALMGQVMQDRGNPIDITKSL